MVENDSCLHSHSRLVLASGWQVESVTEWNSEELWRTNLALRLVTNFSPLNLETAMFSFSFFVFGKLSTYCEPVDASRLAELVQWAIDNDWSYSIQVVTL